MRARGVLGATAIVLALAIFGARRNRIDADLIDLLPRDTPAARGMERYARLFGRDDTIVVLVEGDAASERADRVTARLRADPAVRAVRDRVGESALEYVRRHALVLLGDAEWVELERRAADPRTGRRLRAALNSPAGALASDRLLADPLGMTELVGRRLSATTRVDAQSGRFLSPDGRAALLLVSPQPGRLPARDPGASWTGAPIYAAVYEAAVKRDLLISSLASFGAILVLFGAFFRSLRILPIVGIALALAYLLTLGLWGALVGRIGAVALAFGGILLGIGVDVPIQLWSRVREELATHPPLEALRRAVRALAGVSIVATLGPAAVFAACALSKFRGLAQLGGLAALGLCVNLAVMLIVLPALLAATARLWAEVPRAVRGERWLERLGAACARRHRLVLALAGILVGVSGWLVHPRMAAHPLAFEATLEPARVEQRIEELFGRRRGRVIALCESASLEDALAREDRVTAALRTVAPGGVQSLADLLPAPSTQAARIARIAAQRANLEAHLRKTLDDAGLRAEAFAPFFAQLAAPQPATLDELEASDLAPLVRTQLARDGAGFALAVFALPDSPERAPSVADAARAAGATATGAPLVEAEIAAVLPRDLVRASGFSVGFVALLLLLHYRRVRPTLYVLLPLAVAWVVFLALAPPLSVFTVIAVPLVIGYGIDDHVFLVGRVLEGRDAAGALRLAGRAVVLTSLATLAGFLSLLLASFTGIRALGAAGALAVALCFAAAMILLPALISVSGQTRDDDHRPQT